MPTPTVSFNQPSNSKAAQPRNLLRTADGHTPFIEQPIRLVSRDTPEKTQYAGSAPVSQSKLDVCRQRLQGAFYSALPQSTWTYLLGRLGPTAAADHIEAGVTASGVLESTLATRLTRPNGSRRRIGVIPTGEVIDRYGRMLAYIVPWYSGSNFNPLPPMGDPARATFNLSMIANGWAAFFPIFRSLPKDQDMNMAIAAATAQRSEGPHRSSRTTPERFACWHRRTN